MLLGSTYFMSLRPFHQPGGAYHTTREARLDYAGTRVKWNITGLWGTSLLNSRDKLLAELFPDLSEEYNDWHLTSTDPCKPFGSSRPRCWPKDLAARWGPSLNPDDGG